ncbi:proprotein convertase P-domain-containing protein [Nocardioides sp.]|uniref:proprotein convertase P-domain-containing protein n=1 Tax=Nocardioides sp. TaxID=35761 RepID=UPI002CF82606|nr:proprotein convertase P-domain-containing protein [Nocardioides sp.]HXH80078.1 proprotein convertase P-domain-containing protein [Nocardioides sp.]
MTSTHTARRRARILPVSLLTAALLTTSLGAPAGAVSLRTSFAQTTPIFLGDPSEGGANGTDVTIPSSGPASLYPSEIVITQAARIVDVDVYLAGLTHTFPDDLEVMLVGPGGQQVMLMGDAGGDADISNINLTFSDEAGAPISGAGPLATSTVRPATYGPFSIAAPAPSPNGNTSMSVFDGTLTNGTWKLFVYDDSAGDLGSLSQWGLTIQTETVPYPSQVSVSGIGPVTDLNVTLDNITSTYPDDMDLLLVGPGGQQSTLMSDAGGSTTVTDLDLTLDDEAATDLPGAGPLVAGTFRPTNIANGADSYPAPAPAPSGATALSAFDGTDPNGTWQLFAADTVSGDFARIGGWSLDIEWDDAAGPVGSVSINAGAATTKSTAVTLSLSATDPAPSTGVTQMRFSNDGTTYSAFQPYATTAAWSLSAGDGVKTVFAQFKDGVGNVTTVSDTITLDTTVPAPAPVPTPPVDTVGPLAKKFKPGKNATGVKPTARVKVFASEALAAASVTKATVVLKKKGGSKIKARVSYDSVKKQITLKPKRPLRKGTYTVTVSTKVTDVRGNAWDQKAKPGAQPLKWSFKV